MIRRQCPVCGENWYSAVTDPWKCEGCGAVLDDRHNRPLEEKVKSATEGRDVKDVGNKLRWQ